MWIEHKNYAYWCNFIGYNECGEPQYCIEDWNGNHVFGSTRKKVRELYKKRKDVINLDHIMKANKYLRSMGDVEVISNPPVVVKAVEPIVYHFPLAPTQCTAPCAVPCPKQEKENNMGYEYNLETEQRNHLKRRIDNVRNEHYETARKTYHQESNDLFKGMTKDQVTALLAVGQAIKLKDNAFTSDGKVRPYFGMYDVFELVDSKRDDAGFEKASEAIETAYVAAKDAALVLPLTDGLKALQDFEAQVF